MDISSVDTSDLGLTEREEKIAVWVAAPLIGIRGRPPMSEYAKQNGIPLSSAYRIANSERVRDAVAKLVQRCLTADALPGLWEIVLTKASKDAGFALKVIKELHGMGVTILPKAAAEQQKAARPASIEMAVMKRRAG